jgi:hypothetical protein
MTPAAQCPLHPQRTAARTCARCGNFMCDECSLNGSELNCPKCRALLGTTFPFTRDNHDFSRVWDFTFEAWKREWVMLSIGTVLVIAAAMAAGLIGNVLTSIVQGVVGTKDVVAFGVSFFIAWLFVQVLQQAAIGAVQMGFVRMCFDVLAGGKADIGRMFTQIAKIPTFLGQFLIVFLMIGLPTILYYVVAFVVAIKLGHYEFPGMDFTTHSSQRAWGEVILGVLPVMGGASALIFFPMVWVYLGLTFISFEIVYSGAGAWEAIRRSFALARGFRLPIFGYWIIAILITIVGTLACCVGILPAFALFQSLFAALYLSLRNGSGLPPPAQE